MKFCDVRQSRLSKRNLFARFCITLVYNVIITFLAALIPFFGEHPDWSASAFPQLNAMSTFPTYVCLHSAKSLRCQPELHALGFSQPQYLHYSQHHQSAKSVSVKHADITVLTDSICMMHLDLVLMLELFGKSVYHVVTPCCGQTALHVTSYHDSTQKLRSHAADALPVCCRRLCSPSRSNRLYPHGLSVAYHHVAQGQETP